MNLNRNSYGHIKSFEDFENEKIKLYYQIRLSEKKLELKYIELVAFLNPMRFVPFLISSWLTPLTASLKNFILGFFTNNAPQAKTQNSEEKVEE
ncbi:hypothetical protein [Carboxylicivirga taeanensis]|uniref:hypothetical protein n=1 Tax=Carboxylicivirga taeanensis TaxID=1416875 RepID=UPI003F6E0B0A